MSLKQIAGKTITCTNHKVFFFNFKRLKYNKRKYENRMKSTKTNVVALYNVFFLLCNLFLFLNIQFKNFVLFFVCCCCKCLLILCYFFGSRTFLCVCIIQKLWYFFSALSPPSLKNRIKQIKYFCFWLYLSKRLPFRNSNGNKNKYLFSVFF